MKLFRLCRAAAAVLLFALPAVGQVPTGYVQVTGANLTDSSGVKLGNGTISFAPVNSSGQAISYQINGAGQSLKTPVTTLVTTGAFSIQLADTALTNPVNVCFLVTVTDNTNGKSILGPGYTCFQPAGSGSAVTSGMCTAAGGGTGGTCNFDKFQPNLAGLVLQQTGPTGPIGPVGPTGSTGPPNSLAIGTVTTIPGGGQATATITGTPPNQTLNMGLVTGNTGPSGPTGAPLNFLGPWSSTVTYTVGQVVVYNNMPYVALIGNTNVTPVDGATWIHISGTDVICQGTNDTPTLQTALNNAGFIRVKGNCVMSPSGGHLTIKSGTTLETYAATITYNPSISPGDPIIQNTQNAQTPQRTLTDVVTTAGSAQITSASGAFTQADVGQSIDCLNAYGPGASVGWAPSVGPDLHTSIINITSATSVTLADAASVSINPATCSILVRDTNITILGGVWSLGYQNTGNSAQNFKMKTVNNLTIKDVTTYAGAIGNMPTTQGSFQMYILDASGVDVENITLNGWVQGQDGIHFVGPLRNITVKTVHGHSGDDFVAFNVAEGTGISNAQVDGNIYGVIQGVLIDDIAGSSYANEAGVKLAGVATGNPMYMRDVTVRHVNGGPYGCPTCQSGNNRPGFGDGVRVYNGYVNNLLLEDIGGTLFGGGVSMSGITGGSITIKDVWQSTYPFQLTYHQVNVASFGTTAWIPTPIPSVIQNLTIDGIKTSGLYTTQTSIATAPGSTVNTLNIRNLQLTNLSGGNYIPVVLVGTFDDIIFSNIQISYASGNIYNSSHAAVADITGVTANHITADHVHVTYLPGAVSDGIANFVVTTYQPGSIASSVGAFFINDMVINAPAGANLFTHMLYASATLSTANLNSYTIVNSSVNNIDGCMYGTPISSYAVVANISTSTLGSFASTCAQTITGQTITGPLIVQSSIANSGNFTTQTLTTPGVATVTAASTGGTGFTDNTVYYWKFTAVNLTGQSLPGAERTTTVCPVATYPSGCSNAGSVTISFPAVPAGAVAWNVYRGTASNGELLCSFSPVPTAATYIDTGAACSGAAPPAANTSTGNITTATHFNQTATKNIAGTCAMASTTSCTVALNQPFTSAPICMATPQGVAATFYAACSTTAGSTTVTVTANASNSLTWGVMLIGNPN